MNKTCSILVVGDDEGERDELSRQLFRLGYSCKITESGESALGALKAGEHDIVFIDLCVPNMDGIALLIAVEELDLDVVPVVISDRGSVSSGLDAMRHGAFDYVEKGYDTGVLRNTVERAMNHRRITRQARQMSETAQQWEATFNAVPDLMAIIDTEHRFVRVNKMMADRLGCTQQEAVGKTCYKCVHGLNDPIEECPHTQLLRDNEEHVASIVEEGLGGRFLVSTSPLYDTEGVLIGSVHVARDITEREKIHEDLRKAHMEMDRLVSSMSSFLIEVDMDLRVRRWNAAAEKLFGVSAQEVLEKPFAESGIGWDWDRISGELTRWVTSGESIRLPEIRYERPGGVEGMLGITVNYIEDDDGQPAGFFLLGADITGRRTLELQLVQAQKLESIGQLAAGIAHEINTPTQYVGDNTEFLQCAFEQLEELRIAYDELLESMKAGAVKDDLVTRTIEIREKTNVEYLVKQIPRAISQSLEGVGRISSIVRAMKEFSHPGTEEKTRIDLNQSIESTITVSRNEWKYVADLETNFDPSLPHVVCLPGEFNQVLLNILVNAAHAISDVIGGGGGGHGKGLITVHTRRDDNQAEIRISDTGPGIPEEARTRIFDPFYTTKEVGRGTGQGLAIAHNVIVEKHGGTLTFETEIGKGTTFVIRIPISGGQGDG